jgi:hypothetical protein
MVFNLQGIIVGNGATDFTVDVSPSFSPTVYNFNLITESLYNTFEDNNCFFTFNDVIPYPNSQVCNDTWDAINTLCEDLNWYDLYRPVYPDSMLLQSENRYGEVEINGETKKYKRGMTYDEYTPWMKKYNLKSPILGNYVSDYLNRDDVKKALNIPDTFTDVWEMCTDKVVYHS